MRALLEDLGIISLLCLRLQVSHEAVVLPLNNTFSRHLANGPSLHFWSTSLTIATSSEPADLASKHVPSCLTPTTISVWYWTLLDQETLLGYVHIFLSSSSGPIPLVFDLLHFITATASTFVFVFPAWIFTTTKCFTTFCYLLPTNIFFRATLRLRFFSLQTVLYLVGSSCTERLHRSLGLDLLCRDSYNNSCATLVCQSTAGNNRAAFLVQFSWSFSLSYVHIIFRTDTSPL